MGPTKSSSTGSGATIHRDIKAIVFTDMAGSTQLKQELGDAAALQLMYTHHEMVRDLLRTFPDAEEIGTEGDSFFISFNAASNAVRFALQLQARLRRLSKALGHRLRDRVGIHVGEVSRKVEVGAKRLADLHGLEVDTCARVMSLASPDHILLTRFAHDNALQALKGVPIEGLAGFEFTVHGLYTLKGLSEPVEICEVFETGVITPLVPPDSEKAWRVKGEPSGIPLQLEGKEKTFLRRLKTASRPELRQAVFCGGAIALLGAVLLFARCWDHASFDFCHLTRLGATPQNYTNTVEFVDLNYSSLKELNQRQFLDWDRGLHGRLVDKMKNWGAKAVIFDVLFDTQRPEQDKVFLEAIRGFTNVAVAMVERVSYESGHAIRTPELPFDELRTNVWFGAPETSSKVDFAIREPRRSGNDEWNSLAQEVAARFNLRSNLPAHRVFLNYYCPPNRIHHHSYWQILSNAIPGAGLIFSNKFVYVGYDCELINPDERPKLGADEFQTPYSFWNYPYVPGMVANATSFLNLIRGDWLVRISNWLELLLVCALGAGLGFLLAFLSPVKSGLTGLCVALGLAGLSLALFAKTGLWFNWLIPCAAQAPLAVLWSVLANTRRLTLEKRLLHEALAARRTRTAGNTPGSRPLPTPVPIPPSAPVAASLLIPDHELVKIIGEGAFGQVWLARDIIGTYQAVKIVRRAAFSEVRPYDQEFEGIKYFTPISRKHPNLLQILHVGRNDAAGFFYYIMEVGDDQTGGQTIDPGQYVPRNLSQDVARRGPWPVKEALNLAIPLAEALGFLHGQNLIHRDIKPANIIFVDGKPKLADIGLVTEMVAGKEATTFVDTAGYAAPEGPGTEAADVYSLGKALYVACTGCPVQQFPKLPSSLATGPENASLQALLQILTKASAANYTERYPTTKTLLDDLRSLRESIG